MADVLNIKNLKVSLNISWSPIDYNSIYYIISNAVNTSAITISVSPYTYNLLSEADFELATSKNITIAVITTNYVEDKRLSAIASKADKLYVDEQIAAIGKEDLKEKDLVVTYADGSSNRKATHSVSEIKAAFNNGQSIVFVKQGENLNLLEVTDDFATFYIIYLNTNNKVQQKIVALSGYDVIVEQDDTYDYVTKDNLKSYYSKTEVDTKIADLVNSAPETLDTLGELATALQENEEVTAALNQAIADKANKTEALLKTEQTLTDEELAQVHSNLKVIGEEDTLILCAGTAAEFIEQNAE